MMRCALCLLLASMACGLDDDGCLAQASLRVHAEAQEPERTSLFADTVRGLWKAYVKKQLADMGETVSVDQAPAPSAAHKETGVSSDAKAQETEEATVQLRAVADEERGSADAGAHEAKPAAEQLQAAAEEERGSADLDAQEAKEAAEQLQGAAEEERGPADVDAQEAKEVAEQLQAVAEEEETSPAQAEEDEQRSPAQQEAEPHQRASELKSAKYGEQMTLLVKDVLGREFHVQFRRSTPLRVLMGSVCKRLGLEQSQVFFKHNGAQLNGDDTPEAVGVVDQDTIEVDGQVLQEMKAAKEKAKQKAATAAKLKAEREAKEAVIVATKGQKKMRVAKHAAKVQTQQKREHMLRTREEGTLRFSNGEGKEIQMSYKKLNWLRGLMSLVCKRFGMDPEQARFFHGNKQIGPHDSIQSLGLRDDELITVKSA